MNAIHLIQLFSPALLMFSRRPGARFNLGRVPDGPATPSVPAVAADVVDDAGNNVVDDLGNTVVYI